MYKYRPAPRGRPADSEVACAAVRVAVGHMGLWLCVRLRVLADGRGVASGADGSALSARALH